MEGRAIRLLWRAVLLEAPVKCPFFFYFVVSVKRWIHWMVMPRSLKTSRRWGGTASLATCFCFLFAQLLDTWNEGDMFRRCKFIWGSPATVQPDMDLKLCAEMHFLIRVSQMLRPLVYVCICMWLHLLCSEWSWNKIYSLLSAYLSRCAAICLNP
jgi:hypothetical protein